jgi:hypothetical protein
MTDVHLHSIWNGFTIVIDNLDKNVSPRYKRVDNQTKSLHFCNGFAAHDRINLEGVSDEPSQFANVPVNDLPLKDLLPTDSDNQQVIHNFSILVSRVLTQELKYFNHTFEGCVTNHIYHEHYEDMSKKSETVNDICTIAT